MSILNYIEKIKEMYEGERITAQGPRTGFKDGNGVYDEKELLGKRVRELMDEGYDFGEAVKQAMKEGYADGGRIGFLEGGDVDTLKDLYNQGLSQENIAIELNTSRADITRNIKKLKDQNILKDRDILQVTKKNPKFLKNVKTLRNILEKEIKEFNKNKILPKEKYTANLTELGEKMKVSGKAIENYLAEIKDLDFDIYGAGGSAPTQLSIKDQNKFKKHYKTKTIAQMAREITGKELRNKETRAVYGKLERFRDTLDKKGIIDKKESLLGQAEKNLGYKRTAGETFRIYEEQQKRLAAKDPDISKNLKYFKKSGEFSVRKLDTELLKFLNMDTVKGSLDLRFPKFLKPSFEHIQGITPGDIIGDSEALRKVEIATRRYNFKEMGAKSNLYRDVKNYLRTAQAAIKNNEMGIADEALKVVNDLYTKASNRFSNLDRKDLPNYSIKDGIVKETNLKGLIEPKKIENSFKTFFKSVADTTTKSELETIKRVQPNAFKVIDLFQKGKVNEGYNFIKTRMPSVKGGGKFAVPILAGGAALNFLTSPAEAAEAQAATPGEAADYAKWMFDSGLSARDRAKILGTAAIGDWAVNKSQISKAFLKGLPFIWTPMGDALIHKLMSDKEPVLEDFAEGLKKGGYDINSDEFKKAWNTIPEEDRKEMLYDWSGQVIDKRSTREKVSDAAASPFTHAQYAFWESGVKSMEKLLKTNPGSSVLKNKLKQAALFGIRMGIPRKVIKTISPIGWQLTAATTVGKVVKGSEPQAFYKDGEPIFKEPSQVLPSMFQEYQRKFVPEKQRDKSIIDYSLSGDIERYRKNPDDLKTIAQRNRNTTPHFLDWALRTPLYKKYQEENKAGGGRAGYMGGGIAGIRKPNALPPTGGPQSQGLASTPEYGTYNKEYKWQT